MSQGGNTMLYYGSYTEHLMFSFRVPRKLKQDLKVMFKKYKTEHHSHWDQHRRTGHNSVPVQIHVWSFVHIFFPPLNGHQHLRSVTFLRPSLPSVEQRACAQNSACALIAPPPRPPFRMTTAGSFRLLCHGGRRAVTKDCL